jgi:hypothetical protein
MRPRSGVEFNIRGDLRGLERDLRGVQKRQIPFAQALALTALASRVAAAETAALATTFDRPTPFTERAFGVRAATKGTQRATVYVRDRQEAYLEPYLDPQGGRQVLGGKSAVLMPIDVAKNQFGNIPRGQLKQLKGRPGVFIGPVRTRNGGTINGVWQRPTAAAHVGKGKRGARLANLTGHLKLLIRFTQPVEVGSQHNLKYYDRAGKVIDANVRGEFDKALAKAMSTAR